MTRKAAGKCRQADVPTPNSLRKVLRFTAVDLVVDVDPEHSAARLSMGDEVAIVKRGEDLFERALKLWPR